MLSERITVISPTARLTRDTNDQPAQNIPAIAVRAQPENFIPDLNIGIARGMKKRLPFPDAFINEFLNNETVALPACPELMGSSHNGHQHPKVRRLKMMTALTGVAF